MHAGEEDYAPPGWTTPIRRQDYLWKSQSEWQRTAISWESTSMVWSTLGSKTAKEQNWRYSQTCVTDDQVRPARNTRLCLQLGQWLPRQPCPLHEIHCTRVSSHHYLRQRYSGIGARNNLSRDVYITYFSVQVVDFSLTVETTIFDSQQLFSLCLLIYNIYSLPVMLITFEVTVFSVLWLFQSYAALQPLWSIVTHFV